MTFCEEYSRRFDHVANGFRSFSKYQVDPDFKESQLLSSGPHLGCWVLFIIKLLILDLLVFNRTLFHSC